MGEMGPQPGGEPQETADPYIERERTEDLIRAQAEAVERYAERTSDTAELLATLDRFAGEGAGDAVENRRAMYYMLLGRPDLSANDRETVIRLLSSEQLSS